MKHHVHFWGHFCSIERATKKIKGQEEPQNVRDEEDCHDPAISTSISVCWPTSRSLHSDPCALLTIHPPHASFPGLSNTAGEVQQSCIKHVERRRFRIQHAESQPSRRDPIGAPWSRVWPRGVQAEMWSRLRRTVRGTVRTSSVSSESISVGRLLAGVYTRLQCRNSTRPPLAPICVCLYFIIVKSD